MIKIFLLLSGLLCPLAIISSCSKSGSSASSSSTSGTSTTCSTSGNDIIYTELTRPSGLPSVSGYTSDGPGPRRILLATSSDGLTFTRSAKLVSDQANTPNMIVLSSGRILLYYTAYDVDGSAQSSDGNNQDAIVVAVSDDQGANWKHYCVGMTGFGAHPPIGDPDVIKLSNGTYRMYVTNGDSSGNISILSATSTDGFNFTKEGTALNTSSTNYKDSLTALIGSQYVMFVLNSTNGYMKKAVSTNGTSFTAGTDSDYQITVSSAAQSFVLSNWFDVGNGTFRVFAFSGATKDIRSFTTTDGSTFTADSTVSLGLPLNSSIEKSWVKDAAVQKLTNGTYLMAYVTETP